MAAEQEDRGGANVHWLVAGQFGLGARGKTLSLTRGDFNEALEKAGIVVTATVPDTIGSAETRVVTFKVDSLKALTLKHIVASVPDLTDLAGKADKVATLKDPTREQLVGLFGEGKLLERLMSAISPDEAPPAPAAGADVTGNDIFEKGAVQEKSAKSAIDMFVRSTATSSRAKAKPSGRKLRDLVEEAVWAAAADVLASPEVYAVETAWRGLRFLLTECPKDAKMSVEVLETDPAHLLEALAGRERGDDIDEPDCIFVPYDYPSTDSLAELAELAEQELIPIVVGVAPSVFGQDEPQSIPSAFEALEHARNDDLPEWVTKWNELREQQSTRWLCAVTNRVALQVEGKGVAERKVFGSGVWGMAAMLASSYRQSGGFARVLGKAGSVRGPATHTLSRGSFKDTAAPTEAFYAISPSEVLAKHGVLGMGSARNSDALTLIKTPMVCSAKDAVPLPAQMVTGRVVRFAGWVKTQLPEGCNSKTANDLYMAAANVFLFPGTEEAAHVRAATTNIDGAAHVFVHARANPAIASIPFEIAFPLPLGWSVLAPENEDDVPEGSIAESPVEKAQRTAGDMTEVRSEGAERGDGVGLESASVGFGAGLVGKDD